MCIRNQTERNRRRRRAAPVGGDRVHANPSRRGLVVEQIDQLPTTVIEAPATEADRPICSICFDTIEDGECVFQLACRHRHHQDCLRDWLVRKAECPECRTAVSVHESGGGLILPPPSLPPPPPLRTPTTNEYDPEDQQQPWKVCADCGTESPAGSTQCISCAGLVLLLRYDRGREHTEARSQAQEDEQQPERPQVSQSTRNPLTALLTSTPVTDNV
eukprot:SAG31_NODE_1790_length_7264_cov_3.356455_5_plen_217_part_00